jgi:uncharacterized FAD-dependent dehydrogenase
MSQSPWLKISNLQKSITNDLELRELAAKHLKISPAEITEIKILRESLDARKKSNLKFIYTLAIRLVEASVVLQDSGISVYEPAQPPQIEPVHQFDAQPVIIGSGPAGLFAALALVEKGYQPIIFERGKPVEDRSRDVSALWNQRIFNENSNALFGEGGAGTFSDGKLTARNQDFFTDQVLNTLIRFGAPAEIGYQQKPHIGTDKLRQIIPEIRQFLIENGAKIHFNSKLDDLEIKNQSVTGVSINNQILPAQNLILAIGHSARDVYRLLIQKGVKSGSKAFAVGVRAEHPRKFIDSSQYGRNCDFQITGAADYRLTYNSPKDKRGIYSFCMCPGGEVILANSASEEVVINGMSSFARNKALSNAGIVVTVHPDDFGAEPLNGIEFQEQIEKNAFKLSGDNYNAPAQTIADFVKNQFREKLKKSSYRPDLTAVDFNRIFPAFITDALREGLKNFNQKIPGFIEEGLLIAPETRTSSPIRILRNENSFESVNIKGLFPIGEGAGYAGGIVSSAADGLKLAFRVKPR